MHVRHQWPPKLEPPPQGRWVLMQPWEFGSLPKAWLPALRQVDEVWAYSRSVRDCYLDAGMPADRVHVVPLGVDPEGLPPRCQTTFAAGRTRLPVPVRRRHDLSQGIRSAADSLYTSIQPLRRRGTGDQGHGHEELLSGPDGRGAGRRAPRAGLSDRVPRSGPERPGAGCTRPATAWLIPIAAKDSGSRCWRRWPADSFGDRDSERDPPLDYASEATAFLVPASGRDPRETGWETSKPSAGPGCGSRTSMRSSTLLRTAAPDLSATRRAKGAAASSWIRDRFTWSHSAGRDRGPRLSGVDCKVTDHHTALTSRK